MSREIAVTDALRHLEEGARLLDVREQDEWDAGHVDGALHVPSGLLAGADLDPGTTYLVTCRSGARSAQAVAPMQAAGLDAADLLGGMVAWEEAGLPLRSSLDVPPRVITHGQE